MEKKKKRKKLTMWPRFYSNLENISAPKKHQLLLQKTWEHFLSPGFIWTECWNWNKLVQFPSFFGEKVYARKPLGFLIHLPIWRIKNKIGVRLETAIPYISCFLPFFSEDSVNDLLHAWNNMISKEKRSTNFLQMAALLPLHSSFHYVKGLW